RLHAAPETNTETHVLASVRGTAVHTHLEPLLESLGYEVESEVEYAGILGHVDAFRDGVVEDTKSCLASKARALRMYGPSEGWRIQVQGYARAKAEKGIPVHTVRIVAYAIDSSEELVVWEEPYDPDIAERAVGRVDALAAQDDPPEPGMDASWCESFCTFYGACPGRQPSDTLPELDDPVLAAAVADLRAAREDVKAATERKKAAEETLRGVV